MKKLFAVFVLAILCAYAKAQVIQVKQVPQVVVTTFQSSNPNTSNVEWYQVDNNYEAVYNNNKNDMYVLYDPTGKVVETGEGVVYTTLPENATMYVKTKYKEDGMKKVYKVKDANGKTIYKGKVKSGYLIFDSDGNFVRETKY